MTSTPEQLNIRALFLGDRINMKALETSRRLASSPLVVDAGENGYAIIFRYGVLVLCNLTSVEEIAFVESFKQFVIEPHENMITEDAVVHINAKEKTERVETDSITLNKFTIEQLQIIAIILSKSVVLDYYENKMSTTFEQLTPMADVLQKGMPRGKHARGLLSHMGHTLSIERKMIGQVEIEDKPDILWNSADLERLYIKLEDEYELTERLRALKNKLDLVHKTSETLFGLLQEKRTYHVEWYITLLIVFEIIITLTEKFWH
jgi:uncharacterized Rmd1/YagE family protein